MAVYYARTNEPKWQELAEHLKAVSNMAGEFADEFSEKEWGRLLGLLHDIGKYSAKFQARLHNPALRVDHSTAGAKEIGAYIALNAGQSRWPGFYSESLARLTAGIIAGHHGGLPYLAGKFDKRRKRYSVDYSEWKSEIALPGELPPVDWQALNKLDKAARCYFLAFRTRMLYSCLVDADRLNAESVSDPHKAGLRKKYAPILELLDAFNRFIDAKTDPNAPPDSVNAFRNTTLADARRAAAEAAGIFRLTVPTGGGKTYSSLAFALAHARRCGKRRIIYVIPYTSIIEQTADAFRKALGPDLAHNVVEHHSNYFPPEYDADAEQSPDDDVPPAWENWDAPIVVTTAVQFFESLHAASAAAARKIHNIANSVVIIDEAQNLPVELLRPCVKVIGELTRFYNASVVLCTATQPALDDSAWLPEGFSKDEVREICSDVPGAFDKLKRVTVSHAGKLDDDALADRLLAHNRVLCIVNTRRHARELFHEVRRRMRTSNGNASPGLWHLSANMHPQHRRAAIQRIRSALAGPGSDACIVISTQLVEAGVDLDFPVVYRCGAGLDSIAQAAGRCNREGKLPFGEVYIFDNDAYAVIDKTGVDLARGFFARPENADADPLAPETMSRYFKQRYSLLQKDELDKEKILADIVQLFPEVDYPLLQKKFRIIKDSGYAVVAPVKIDAGGASAVNVGESEVDDLVLALRENIKTGVVPRTLLRRLQAYTVSLREGDFNSLKRAGAIECLGPDGVSFALLVNRDLYSSDTGITAGDPTAM